MEAGSLDFWVAVNLDLKIILKIIFNRVVVFKLKHN